MARIITFGEILLRLAPPGYDRLIQTAVLGATFGGAESNAAVALACWGEDAAFVSKVPAHAVGQMAINSLRRYGVDTHLVLRGGNRLGTYFLERGASQRASQVIYDRAASAIAEALPEEFDWEAIFDGADWFHVTGITPALSDRTAAATVAACRAARAHGLTVSCDLNYRSALWSRERAREVMSEIVPLTDVCLANDGSALDVFGIDSDRRDEAGRVTVEGLTDIAAELTRRFGCRQVALTVRESRSASDNRWSALLYENGRHYVARTYDLHIVDRVGGGDGFAAGMIYADLHGYAPQDAVEFATAAGALKHSIEGDLALLSVDEVKALADGDGSGRIRR